MLGNSRSSKPIYPSSLTSSRTILRSRICTLPASFSLSKQRFDIPYDCCVRESTHYLNSQALSVERGIIKTENNLIIGNLTASELLILETNNSPIAVNVTLVNDPEKKFDGGGDRHAEYSKFFIKTSNSPIHGTISLAATTKDHSGGKFLVGAFTSNSPLHIRFADAPVDSTLRFNGFTSNSPAVALLHPTYQGDLLVKSNLFGPKVEVKEDVKDPSGEGRSRTVDVSKAGKEITGKVYWGSEDENEDVFGSVRLGSTLFRSTLKL